MGRDAIKAHGNVWRDARLQAAKYDERLNSRESVADMLGVGVDAIRRIETNANKTMPVDTAVLMADLYSAPELLNHYCLNECPIGCNRPISDEVLGIDRVTLKLLKTLNAEDMADIKTKLIDIAEDGVISDDELPALEEVIDYLDRLSKAVSELKIISEKAFSTRGKHRRRSRN